MNLAKSSIVLAVLLLSAGLSVEARLRALSLQEFRSAAPCGFVVSVDKVEQDTGYMNDLEQRLLAGEEVQIEPDIHATMRVLAAFGEADHCLCRSAGLPDDSFTMSFFSEVHSSHPEAGDRAVVFPKKVEGAWREAVYGSSYWPFLEGSTTLVRVDWRNTFLRERFQVKTLIRQQFLEIGATKLGNLVDDWGGYLTGRRRDC